MLIFVQGIILAVAAVVVRASPSTGRGVVATVCHGRLSGEGGAELAGHLVSPWILGGCLG
jgi:hypothetical protein